MFWKVVCVCCSMHDAAAAVSVVSDCNPKDCSPPGAVHGILQASILGWVFLLQEIFLTRGRTCISCVAGRFFSPEPPGSPRVQYQFSSVHFSRSVVSDSLRPHESQHARPPCPSPLPEFTHTHVHQVSDAIQPSHPRSCPSPPAPNPSQHQSLFQ